MTSIGVGLIGHGASGAFLHGPLLEAAPDFEIRAIATSRPESLSLRRGSPRAVGVRDCVEADDVDLVVVASPNAMHHRHARLALEARKHVVVEKPFVSTLEEADDLIALADRAQRSVTVFQNRRFDGDFRLARQQIRKGRLGHVRCFTACWDRMGEGTRDPAALFADLASHQIDQAVALFGNASHSRLHLWSISTERGDAVGYDLKFEAEGVGCRLTGRTLSPNVGPSLKVEGVRASLATPRWDPFDALVRSGRHPADRAFWNGVSAPAATFLEDGRTCALRLRPNAWGRFYDQLAAVLRGRRRPFVTHDQMRTVTTLLETSASLSS